MMYRKILACLTAGAALLSVAQANGAQRGVYSGGQFEDETLPPGFRGRITYEGSYTAELLGPRGRNAPSSRNGGAITLDVSFDGNRISGSFRGIGGIGQGSFTGTRSGNSCTVIEPTGARNTVRCDRNYWGGENHTAPGARQAAVVRIEARATESANTIKDERLQNASPIATRATVSQALPRVSPQTLQWFELYRHNIDNRLNYGAFAMVEQSGDEIRYFMLHVEIRSGLFVYNSVNCTSGSIRPLGEDQVLGFETWPREITLVSPENTEPYVNRTIAEVICNRSRWRRVADPLVEGLHFGGYR